MRYLITGRPGTGKSFVTEGLIARGISAFDLEEVPGVIRLEIKGTGEPAEWPNGYVDWDHYAWRMQSKPLVSFLDTHTDDIYVSGGANNQADFYSLFDKVFVLTLDNPEELRRRLETRTAHENGQDPENIDRAVKRFHTKQAELLALGGIAIDNSRPLNEVLDTLISLSYDN